MAQIEFSEEQNMLLDTAGEFCKTHASIALVRAGIEDDQSVKSEVWEEMADLGWMGIIVPEEYGGLGLGLSDVVPIVESMGRNSNGFTLYFERFGDAGAGFVSGCQSESFLAPENR